MTLRERLAGWLFPELKSAQETAPGVGFRSYAPIATARKPYKYSDRGAIAEAVNSSVVTACMAQWLALYPSAPLVVATGEDGAVSYDDATLAWYNDNSAGASSSELLTLVQLYRMLTGTAYVASVENGAGLPVGAEVFHAMNCAPITTKTERVARYEVRIGNDRFDLAPDAVAVLPWVVRDPANPMLGVPPMRAIFHDLSTYNAVASFVFEFLENGAIPGTIVTDPVHRQPADRADIREDLEAKFGKGNRGRVAYVDGGVTLSTFSHGLKDLDVEKLRRVPEANICAGFAVPPELVGVQVGLERSTYNNKAEARRVFARLNVAPYWQSDARALERVFMPTGYDLRFDTTEVPAMREDADAVASRSSGLFSAGVITLNEARRANGYDDIAGGDVLSTATATPEPVQDPEPDPEPTKGAKAGELHGFEEKTAEELDAYWKARADDMAEAEDALASDLVGAMAKVRQLIDTDRNKGTAEVMQAKARGILREVERGEWQGKELPAPFPSLTPATLRELFIEGTKSTREAFVRDMLNASLRDVGDLVAGLELLGEEVDRLLLDAYGASSEKIMDSVETVKRELFEAVAEGTADEIDSAIDRAVAVATVRMATVARTTVTATNGRLQDTAWGAVNKRDPTREIWKEWLSERDGVVRKTHREADRQRVEPGGFFKVGQDRMRAPGNGSRVEENANCRCVCVPITKRKDDNANS